jgi:hypothetical protein
MRTITTVSVHVRCGHCSLPDALHTTEQRATCERRLLADLARSWPRTVPTPAQRDEQATKRMQVAVQAITRVMQSVTFTSEERAAILATVDVFGERIAKRAVTS